MPEDPFVVLCVSEIGSGSGRGIGDDWNSRLIVVRQSLAKVDVEFQCDPNSGLYTHPGLDLHDHLSVFLLFKHP